MSDAAAAAGVPLVYVNRQPINVDSLPDNQAFVGSNEAESGTLETIQLCDNWAAEGKTEVKVYVMQGELSNQAAVQRTQDIYDVIDAGKCKVKINVIDQQTANWSRDQAQTLMTNWLSTGTAFDGVIANNDEMAIGAIQAMKAAGIDMKSVQVGGVDATQDALAAMQAGDLDVTVFQNAAAQGGGPDRLHQQVIHQVDDRAAVDHRLDVCEIDFGRVRLQLHGRLVQVGRHTVDFKPFFITPRQCPADAAVERKHRPDLEPGHPLDLVDVFKILRVGQRHTERAADFEQGQGV